MRDANTTSKGAAQPRRPALTLTGADERTDIKALSKLPVEVGLLYSAEPEGRPRYPSWHWIHQTSLDLPHTSLHVCGKMAREQLRRGSLPVTSFDRIQVNGGCDVEEVEHFCLMYPRIEIITQMTLNHRYTRHVKADNHSLLWDSSGGRGIRALSWEVFDTIKPVGYAGGIALENLSESLRNVLRVARRGWWMDMESSLRTDDWFDMEKARRVSDMFETCRGAFSDGYGRIKANTITLDNLRWLAREQDNSITRLALQTAARVIVTAEYGHILNLPAELKAPMLHVFPDAIAAYPDLKRWEGSPLHPSMVAEPTEVDPLDWLLILEPEEE